jgi:WD40 repeat protein
LKGSEELTGQGAFSPGGRLLAAAAEDGVIDVWEIASGKRLLVRDTHQGRVHALAFSSDGKKLVSASRPDRTARIWDVATGKQLHVLRAGAAVEALAYLPNGKAVVTGHKDGKILVWEVGTGKLSRHLSTADEPQRLPFEPDLVCTLRPSADGKRLTSVLVRLLPGDSLATFFGKPISITATWDLQSGKRISWRPQEEALALAAGLSPDLRVVALPAADDEISLRGVRTGKERRVLRKPEFKLWPAAFSPDGKVLAAWSFKERVWPEVFPDERVQQSLLLWEVASGREVRAIPAPLAGEVVAFSPNGKLLAWGSADRISLREVRTGKEIQRFTGHRVPVDSLAFSPTASGWPRACAIRPSSCSPSRPLAGSVGGRCWNDFKRRVLP